MHAVAVAGNFIASLAGLDPAKSAIAKLSIRFLSTALANVYGAQGWASVWFDNMSVPEPGIGVLMLSDLALLAVGARRHRSKS